MKPTTSWILLALLLTLGGLEACLATPAQAASRVAGQCREITYSTNPNYPPYDWAVGNGFEGASIDLLKMVVPQGVTLKPAVYPWKRALRLAEEGKIDLLVSLRITPERSRYLVFTTHRAFPNPIVVFVRKDQAFAFTSWDELKSRRGGVSLGDTFGGGFDEYWKRELNVDVASNMENNFRKLEAGRIDYFVTGKYVGEAYFAISPPCKALIALDPPVSDQDIHFGFSRLSPCAALVKQVSANLAKLDGQGVPDQLLKKHLHRIQQREAGRAQ